ncbi:hypothetical protein C477_15590 [Haloterrigena salina JCM 13891]|uniref:Uncharacterized protein n=1 Tax=Haloterrigena salina JCM 13891 TaxID=1227488 RepID=M0C1C3_9EURY|nr:hypothetical protein C477_15590 [Haloterrigena salina JCM 13891]
MKEPSTGAVSLEFILLPLQGEERGVLDAENGSGVGVTEHIESNDISVEPDYLFEVVDAECGPSDTCLLGEYICCH